MNLALFRKNKKYKSIPFLVFVSFLLTFIASRATTYFFPETFLNIKGIHIHHLAYGIILMSVLGYILLIKTVSYYNRLRLSVLYGIALGLAYDEFAVWIQLEDAYHSRTNYDVVLTISLLMLITVFFPGFWNKWGNRGKKLVKIILITGPKEIIKLVKD